MILFLGLWFDIMACEDWQRAGIEIFEICFLFLFFGEGTT